MTRTFRSAAFILIAAAVAVVVAVWVRTPHDRTNKIIVAQWGQEKYLIYLPLYIAVEKGYLKDVGLEVEITFSGNDDQVFAAVASGSADFGVGDPAFAAIANEKGGQGRVIATIVDRVAIWGVTKDSKIALIHSPKQLAGLRVGTFPSPSTNYTLMANLVRKNGLDTGSATTIVQAPIGAQLALLESGRADIAMELEPAASLAESKGFRVVYSSPAFYGPFAFTGVTTSTDTIKNNPTKVQKFVDALERAVRFAHENPAGAAEIGRKAIPTLPQLVVERAVKRMLDERTLPQSVAVDENSWQSALAVRVQVGDLKSAQATQLTVDNTFAARANASR